MFNYKEYNKEHDTSDATARHCSNCQRMTVHDSDVTTEIMDNGSKKITETRTCLECGNSNTSDAYTYTVDDSDKTFPDDTDSNNGGLFGVVNFGKEK